MMAKAELLFAELFHSLFSLDDELNVTPISDFLFLFDVYVLITPGP